ncbi:hypothetical protein chiPu_0013972 [Chiloscyllium punctatum]|uniref:Uncharacterized protein n=1 Tax=Chiloscyllium punctatum TaxID=137246 RepID=A0A401SYK6_CHIPU|nr:hypothetical protein [Chiloscyllium punctatum]
MIGFSFQRISRMKFDKQNFSKTRTQVKEHMKTSLQNSFRNEESAKNGDLEELAFQHWFSTSEEEIRLRGLELQVLQKQIFFIHSTMKQRGEEYI